MSTGAGAPEQGQSQDTWSVSPAEQCSVPVQKVATPSPASCLSPPQGEGARSWSGSPGAVWSGNHDSHIRWIRTVSRQNEIQMV